MLANTKSQSLVDHSIAVAMLSKKIFEKTISKEKYEDFLEKIDFPNKKRFSYERIMNSVFIAGLFHDIGKIDDNFQNYIIEKISVNDFEQEYDFQIEETKKNKIDIFKYPLHNELSFAIISALFGTSSFLQIAENSDSKIIENIVYYHHAKIQRDKNIDFSNSGKIFNAEKLSLENLFSNMKDFVLKIKEELKNKLNIDLNISESFEDLELEDIIDKNIAIPVFQTDKLNKSTDLLKNAITHISRSILISADRLISKEKSDFIKQIIEDDDFECFIFDEEINIIDAINDMLEGFKEKYGASVRSSEQSRVAEELSSVNGISVLKGPAGVGKTKIMFEWLKNIKSEKRTFIIVPKTSIALSLYEEIRREYMQSTSVEIVIGDLKATSLKMEESKTSDKDIFSSNIVITTIDQILNMMLGHSKIDVFLEVLNSNLIFDEYHEFLYIPAISTLFIEIIYLKHFLNNQNCLLVSATPNQFLLKQLYVSNKNIKKIRSFNETKYKINLINFEDGKSSSLIKNAMFEKREIGEICIFNTATKAQLSAIDCINQGEKNTLVYHSKYSLNDKRTIFSKIMKEFGKSSQTRNNVLRVGPILQASVDISTKHMHTEISNIDNIYQRLGRVVRWQESEDGKGEYSIYIPNDLKQTGSIRSGLKNVNCLNSTTLFAEFLRKKINSGEEYCLNELYDIYDVFFEENKREIMEAYQLDFEETIVKSASIFKQSFEPIKLLIKKDKNDKKTLPKKSLRGNSLFCLVLDYNVSYDNSFEIVEPKNYLESVISMNKSDFNGEQNLNLYLEESRDKMSKNQGRYKYLEKIAEKIKSNSYNAKKGISKVPSHWFSNFARNEDMPIILSYKDKTTKIDYEEQYFNLTYKGVKIGSIKKKNF